MKSNDSSAMYELFHILNFTNIFSVEAAGSCLGELGPVDFSAIALFHGSDPLYDKAASLFRSTESQCLYIILNCMNDALTQQRYSNTWFNSYVEWKFRRKKIALVLVLCVVVFLVLRWGKQPLSVWRTSSPPSLERTSGINTKTTETQCWLTLILSEQPRRRWCTDVVYSKWYVTAVSTQILLTVVAG